MNMSSERSVTRWTAPGFRSSSPRAKPVAAKASRAKPGAGTEAPTAWLTNTAKAQRLFGAPLVPLSAVMDWVADWVARDRPSLGKPTKFESRDGRY